MSREKVKRRYKFKAPRFFEGERVVFQGHERRGRSGPMLGGEITHVETYYSRDEAYHVYSILPYGWKVRQHVGERFIQREEL